MFSGTAGVVLMGCVGAGIIFIGCAIFFVIGDVFIGFIVTIRMIIVVIHSCGDVMCIDTISVYL